MTSIQNLKQENESHTDIQKSNGNLKKYGKISLNRDQPKYKFKKINKAQNADEEALYQKSLMRIQFLNQ